MISRFPLFTINPDNIEFTIESIMSPYSIPKIFENGTKAWYNREGNIHREDGPAIICSNGSEEYFIDGERHREDGPAIIQADGTEFYYINGRKHRIDGPAYIQSDGYKAYYRNDERNREDGPAIICPDGRKKYWVYGREMTKSEFREEYGLLKRIKGWMGNKIKGIVK